MKAAEIKAKWQAMEGEGSQAEFDKDSAALDAMLATSEQLRKSSQAKCRESDCLLRESGEKTVKDKEELAKKEKLVSTMLNILKDLDRQTKVLQKEHELNLAKETMKHKQSTLTSKEGFADLTQRLDVVSKGRHQVERALVEVKSQITSLLAVADKNDDTIKIIKQRSARFAEKMDEDEKDSDAEEDGEDCLSDLHLEAEQPTVVELEDGKELDDDQAAQANAFSAMAANITGDLGKLNAIEMENNKAKSKEKKKQKEQKQEQQAVEASQDHELMEALSMQLEEIRAENGRCDEIEAELNKDYIAVAKKLTDVQRQILKSTDDIEAVNQETMKLLTEGRVIEKDSETLTKRMETLQTSLFEAASEDDKALYRKKAREAANLDRFLAALQEKLDAA